MQSLLAERVYSLHARFAPPVNTQLGTNRLSGGYVCLRILLLPEVERRPFAVWSSALPGVLRPVGFVVHLLQLVPVLCACERVLALVRMLHEEVDCWSCPRLLVLRVGGTQTCHQAFLAHAVHVLRFTSVFALMLRALGVFRGFFPAFC